MNTDSLTSSYLENVRTIAQKLLIEEHVESVNSLIEFLNQKKEDYEYVSSNSNRISFIIKHSSHKYPQSFGTQSSTKCEEWQTLDEKSCDGDPYILYFIYL